MSESLIMDEYESISLDCIMDRILPKVRLVLSPLIINRCSNSFTLRIYFTDFTSTSVMNFLPSQLTSFDIKSSSSQSSPSNHVKSLSHSSTTSASESEEASKKRKKKISINDSIDFVHIYQISSNEDGNNTKKLIS